MDQREPIDTRREQRDPVDTRREQREPVDTRREQREPVDTRREQPNSNKKVELEPTEKEVEFEWNSNVSNRRDSNTYGRDSNSGY